MTLNIQKNEFDGYYLKEQSLKVHNLARLVHDLGVGIVDYKISDNALSKKFEIQDGAVIFLGARKDLGETL